MLMDQFIHCSSSSASSFLSPSVLLVNSCVVVFLLFFRCNQQNKGFDCSRVSSSSDRWKSYHSRLHSSHPSIQSNSLSCPKTHKIKIRKNFCQVMNDYCY